ncbi:MAG: hypothetical protein WCK39_03110 [Methanomassiliicoccales archaeon]
MANKMIVVRLDSVAGLEDVLDQAFQAAGYWPRLVGTAQSNKCTKPDCKYCNPSLRHNSYATALQNILLRAHARRCDTRVAPIEVGEDRDGVEADLSRTEMALMAVQAEIIMLLQKEPSEIDKASSLMLDLVSLNAAWNTLDGISQERLCEEERR